LLHEHGGAVSFEGQMVVMEAKGAWSSVRGGDVAARGKLTVQYKWICKYIVLLIINYSSMKSGERK
jgi:hypothetical protein